MHRWFRSCWPILKLADTDVGFALAQSLCLDVGLPLADNIFNANGGGGGTGGGTGGGGGGVPFEKVNIVFFIQIR